MAKQSTGRAVTTWQEFEGELAQREKDIVSVLPPHVTRQRFMSSTVAAIKQNPTLLKATPRSLFAAVTKSAQDGLLPDGREGVITIYREKQKDDSWADVAQWNPMTYGLRKRAKELDGIYINAQVVYENDHFERIEGDEPKIDHRPAPLGEDRGGMIGAYAIFRNEAGIQHREVMDADQIEMVRQQSKAPNSLMWAKFTTEAWRKTVIRRGIKSVPCSEKLETVVRRDDDLFNFEPANGNGHGKSKSAITVVQPPAEGERKPLPPLVGQTLEGEIVDEETPPEKSLKDKLLAQLADLNSPKDLLHWGMEVGAMQGLSEPERKELNRAVLQRQDAIAKNTKPAEEQPAEENDAGSKPRANKKRQQAEPEPVAAE